LFFECAGDEELGEEIFKGEVQQQGDDEDGGVASGGE
jgi:hypothetical protein